MWHPVRVRLFACTRVVCLWEAERERENIFGNQSVSDSLVLSVLRQSGRCVCVLRCVCAKVCAGRHVCVFNGKPGAKNQAAHHATARDCGSVDLQRAPLSGKGTHTRASVRQGGQGPITRPQTPGQGWTCWKHVVPAWQGCRGGNDFLFVASIWKFGPGI